MKTLLLMRHAKSSWDDPGLADHERPLNQRGIKAAKKMGRWLLKTSGVPECVLASSAVRAQETWRLVREVWEASGATIPALSTLPELYHCESTVFPEALSRLPDNATSVLVIGHNPGLEEWLADLVGQAEEFPTAAMACIEVSINSWSEFDARTQGTLRGIWRPKSLPDE